MKHIKGFDALRAFSIILVIASHLGLYFELPEIAFYRVRLWGVISGTAGVQVFFTLSGFLITKLLLEEKIKSGKINFKFFYIRRFLRLLPPLFIFFSGITVLMLIDSINLDKQALVYSFFYLYNFVHNNHYLPELAHTWSLAVEEQYYLIWPMLVLFFSRFKITVIIILILILSCIASYVLPTFKFTEGYYTERWIIPSVAPILIGSYFAYLTIYSSKRVVYFFQNFGKALLFVAIFLFVYPLYAPIKWMEIRYVFQAIGIGLLLLWILQNQKSKITQILSFKPVSYIGRISYGIYIYQGLFLRTGPGGELWIQQSPQNIILVLMVAIISFELIERPILKLKKKFYNI